MTPNFNYCFFLFGFCCQRETFSTHSSEGNEANNQHQLYIPHRTCTAQMYAHLCKELRVLKFFYMFYVAVWKFYYKLIDNNLPAYFSI